MANKLKKFSGRFKNLDDYKEEIREGNEAVYKKLHKILGIPIEKIREILPEPAGSSPDSTQTYDENEILKTLKKQRAQ